jgi:hypothetical protein
VDNNRKSTVGDIALVLERPLNLVDRLWDHSARLSRSPPPPPMRGRASSGRIGSTNCRRQRSLDVNLGKM